MRGSLFLGLLVLGTLPVLAQARKGSNLLSWMPEITKSENSQTMDLLEAPKAADPNLKGEGHLAIVDGSALSTESDSGAFVDPGQNGNGLISTYIVRQGDTVASVAKMFNVSRNTILWANNIKGGTVAVGQELVILPVSGVRHVVRSGDTIKSIADKYNGDVNDILAYNDLTPGSKLSVGDEIIIPDGELSGSSASAPGRSIAQSVQTKITASYPSYSGYYVRPISGPKTQGLHGHNGIDFGAPVGTQVRAAAGGTVTVAIQGGYNGGYGSMVVISHPNGTQTVYGHLSDVEVSSGQSVSQGQEIARSGNTGRSTGPHLHFEVRGARNPF